MYKYLLIIISVLFIFSCKNIEKFSMEEENIIKNKTIEIINELGYTEFKILTYYHRDLSNKILSKSIKTNKTIGKGVIPFFDDSVSFNNDFDGFFEHREIIVNYNSDSRNEIVYDYISILIIFDEISTEEKNELIKLLNVHIINGNRGDIVYVISRNEFQNNNISE